VEGALHVLHPAPDTWCAGYLRLAVEHPLTPERTAVRSSAIDPSMLAMLGLMGVGVLTFQGYQWYSAGAWLQLGLGGAGVAAAIPAALWLASHLNRHPIYDMKLVQEKVTALAGRRGSLVGASRPPLAQGLPSLRSRPGGRRLPRIVGPLSSIEEEAAQAGAHLASVALQLSSSDRELLDLIGRHPFLSPWHLATPVGRSVRRLHQECKRLEAFGLTRVVRPEKVPAPNRKPSVRKRAIPLTREALTAEAIVRLELTELTRRGMELLAATWGIPAKAAQPINALAGGGPDDSFGPRGELIKHLAHTVEANGVCVDLIMDARRLVLESGRVAITWRSAAACTRGTLRPDGYVMIECDGNAQGFFLEYDRGTESRRDYRRKLAAYHEYAADGRFWQDYEGFPSVLIVTMTDVAEHRIADAARAVAVGRDRRLPVLLTTEWRLRRDPRNPDGWFGPIWRAAESGPEVR
jgi:hypothetical protein